MVGMLDYWSTGILGLKSELGLICDYQNAHVSYDVGGHPQPITPSLHHSIIPLFLLHSFLAKPDISDLAKGTRFFRPK
jgi:hypothetical protein